MFEKITLDRQGKPGEPIDLGTLAECLVFYKVVRVVVDQQAFPFLVKSCGIDELLDLTASGTLEICYVENLTGTLEKDSVIGKIYDSGNITSSALRYLPVSRKLFDELAGPSGKNANRNFNKFQRIVKRRSYTSEMLVTAREDWLDNEYTSAVASRLLAWMARNYLLPTPVIFTVRHTPLGYQVETNIDFSAANAGVVDPLIEPGQLTKAYFLSHITDTRRDLLVASEDGSEFALSPARTLVASCKFAEIVTKAHNGIGQADLFQDYVVDGIPRIRDAVRSGDKSFADLIKLVEKAQQFKSWLSKHTEDEDIRKSYLRDVSHIDWADKLPPKTLRWLLFAALGFAFGMACDPVTGGFAGAGLSAADYFVLDRLLKGWRPNQFIEGPLKQFLI